MTTALIVLAVFALFLWLSAARPALPPAPADRDRERQLAELRAMSGYRADHS